MTICIAMLNKDSIYVILFSIPVYQLIFYTVQLVSFRRKNPSKKYLGLLLLSMTVFLIFNAIHFLGYTETFSYIYFLYLPVLLSVAPAYFLYILSITRENHDVKKRQRLILFSPAILMLVVNLIFYLPLDHASRIVLLSPNSGQEVLNAQELPALLMNLWILGILMVFAQIAFAVFKVVRIIQQETEIMHQQPTHLAYLEWKWILGISICVLIFLVINVLIEMIIPIRMIGMALVYNLLMLVSGGIAGYMGMKQDDLLNQVEKVNVLPNDEISILDANGPAEVIQPEGAQQFISTSEAALLNKRIINYLETEKPYLKPDFSLHDLCNHLGVSRRKISYVLNVSMEKNFYGIVNEYRIKAAEEHLKNGDGSQFKIEVLGEMVGFQSKSSFNACFKKVTGMTPSEYRARTRA